MELPVTPKPMPASSPNLLTDHSGKLFGIVYITLTGVIDTIITATILWYLVGKSASYLLNLAPFLWWALPAKNLTQVTPENKGPVAQDRIPDIMALFTRGFRFTDVLEVASPRLPCSSGRSGAGYRDPGVVGTEVSILGDSWWYHMQQHGLQWYRTLKVQSPAAGIAPDSLTANLSMEAFLKDSLPLTPIAVSPNQLLINQRDAPGTGRARESD
ncbi:hypothetical protein DSO57_1012109 [Entomophthora muscae]|uniref:Uncharacterized protein n=1 Tax=Entomophthora muscae TaxID=34485 RepID=A0ACC2SIZ3_9FUNG|nr:hypothetical protein DSO57_1012109 [Entomophthora muscae]